MPIVSKTTLKSYFNDGDVPSEDEYEDLIDTMGDMNKSVYDSNDDGKVNSAVQADEADNADTVDGQHASAFAPSGFGLGTTPTDISNQDLNENFQTGFYRGSACLNAPYSSWFHYIIMNHSNTIWYTQIAINYYLREMYFRAKDNGVWEPWEPIYPAAWGDINGKPSTFTPSSHTHGGGDITSQVPDANTVDSLHAASFVRSDADDTKTGDLRMADGLVVGSTSDLATAGEIKASSHICSGGGIRSGSQTVETTSGYVEASTHMVANGQMFGRSSDHYFKSSVRIGYASDIDSNDRMIMEREISNSHLYSYKVNGNSNLFLNWYGGNATYTGAVRCGNRNQLYGNVHADNFVNESSRKSKKNIRPFKDEIESSLKIVERIEPVLFEKSATKDKRRMGMIAEELYPILPEAVVLDENGEPEGIAYSQIVPLLIASIQELQTEIKELKHGR